MKNFTFLRLFSTFSFLLIYLINFSQSQNALNNTNEFLPARPLSEINTSGVDAYPFLSGDGLRLYLTQNRGEDNLYFCSRKDLNSPFGATELINSNFKGGAKSCWLTSDELEIYYTTHSSLFYAKRNSFYEAFSAPVEIELVGFDESFMSAPSLSPDKKELYFFSSSGKGSILIFEKINELSYAYKSKIECLPGFSFKPGQLSKNGLKFYVGMKEDQNLYSKIYVFSRENLNSKFENPVELNKNINNNEHLTNSQMSVSSDESIIVWTRNNDQSWSDNDLFISKSSFSNPITSGSCFRPLSIEIFPNPAKDKLTIDNKDAENAIVTVYNTLGEQIFKTEIISGRNILNIDRFSSGSYIVKISNSTNSILEKFIKE